MRDRAATATRRDNVVIQRSLPRESLAGRSLDRLSVPMVSSHTTAGTMATESLLEDPFIITTTVVPSPNRGSRNR